MEDRACYDIVNTMTILLSPSSITTKKLGTRMQTLGLNPMKAELQDIISEMDTDSGSIIDFYKFLDLVAH
uniref:EF-hand domain-containing protein n=1 Tax=Oryza nivara TaxID=4536 RepID=A0A0E0G4F6_ORYNI